MTRSSKRRRVATVMQDAMRFHTLLIYINNDLQ